MGVLDFEELEYQAQTLMAVTKTEYQGQGKLEPRMGPVVPWAICENGSTVTQRTVGNQNTLEHQVSGQDSACFRAVSSVNSRCFSITWVASQTCDYWGDLSTLTEI